LQAEEGVIYRDVAGVQTCAIPICTRIRPCFRHSFAIFSKALSSISREYSSFIFLFRNWCASSRTKINGFFKTEDCIVLNLNGFSFESAFSYKYRPIALTSIDFNSLSVVTFSTEIINKFSSLF